MTDDFYIILLILDAILFTAMFARVCFILYRNHLQHKVRILMVGVSVYLSGCAIEAWVRAFGRLNMNFQGRPLDPILGGPIGLTALLWRTVGLIVLIVVVNRLAKQSIVVDNPQRRKDDPKPLEEV